MNEIRIRNYRDAGFYELVLKFIKLGKFQNPGVYDVPEVKRALRKFYHKPTDETVMVHDDGIDGAIVRFPLPEWIEDKEDGRVWFMENEYIHFRPSYYDCTGQAFTSWFKVYKHSDGRWWAYHRVSFDV